MQTLNSETAKFLTRGYALKLIKQGKAECVATTEVQVGAITQMYWVINRFDTQTTVHVKANLMGRFHLPLLGKNGYTGKDVAV
jgi:hypothetical protein